MAAMHRLARMADIIDSKEFECFSQISPALTCYRNKSNIISEVLEGFCAKTPQCVRSLEGL
jgi:hypothetical protein